MTSPEVDQPYISAADLRAAVTGLSDETKFPDATLERFISRFEQLAENYRGVAFTPRAATRTIQVAGCGPLLLAHPRVTNLTALSYDVGTAPAFADVVIRDGYALAAPNRAVWPWGTWVTVSYVHGYPEPPAAIIDACIEFVKCEAQAQKSAAPRSASTRTDEATGYTYTEVQADPSAGRPTKWAPVNNALNEVPDERIPGIG